MSACTNCGHAKEAHCGGPLFESRCTHRRQILPKTADLWESCVCLEYAPAPLRPPRLYLAGPMSGLPESNYPAFHEAAALWRSYGWDVINPAEAFDGATDLPYRTYADHDVAVLRTCDAIAMLPGWDAPTARGSIWEHAIAEQLLGLRVFDAQYPVRAL